VSRRRRSAAATAGLALLALALWWITPANSPDVHAGLPQPQDWRLRLSLHVLRNPGFTVGYSEWHRAPAWVAFRASSRFAERGSRRLEDFSVDRRTLVRVSSGDYRGSGYDRGHLAPNYLIARLYGAAAQRATFLMSNVAPQTPRLNQLLWQRLEEAEADVIAPLAHELWIITGPVFGGARLPSGVSLPAAYWRIWLDLEPLRALAFMVPQDVCGDEPLDRYAVSVDAVEAATGLDFFAAMEDAAEARLEGALEPRPWKLESFARQPARYADKFREPCKITDTARPE